MALLLLFSLGFYLYGAAAQVDDLPGGSWIPLLYTPPPLYLGLYRSAIMRGFQWNLIGKGLVVLSFTIKTWSLCPNWCSQHGICSGTTEDATCTCEYGYVGDGCEVRLCPWGYDSLSEGQNSRVIRVTTTAVAGELEGLWALSFQGETVEIDANANKVDGKMCSAAVSELPNIESATCIRGDIDSHLGTTYTITIQEWPLHPKINNIYTHDGNPPVEAFSCSMSQVHGAAYNPSCEIDDVVGGAGEEKDNVRHYVECSRRGTCNREIGTCECFLGFKGLACEDMTDAEDVAVHVAEGPFFTASVLKLQASARKPSPDFKFIEAYAGEEPIFTVDGLGHLETSGCLTASGSLSVDRGADISQSLTVIRDELSHSTSSSPALNITGILPFVKCVFRCNGSSKPTIILNYSSLPCCSNYSSASS